jgi:hypothetical protein
MTSETPTFFFFGCWNRDTCPGCEQAQNSTPLRDNRAMVLENLSKQKFDFGIIAGDNVYPIKSKDTEGKKKTYFKETLERGVRSVRKAIQNNNPTMVSVIMGNHNAAASVAAAEEELFNDKNGPFKLYQEPATYVPHISNSGEILYEFIFINTNYDVSDITIGIEDCMNNKCQGKRVYIIGHEPIIAARLKKQQMFTTLDCADTLLEFLFERIRDGWEIAYLCADVHNFQALTVSQRDDQGNVHTLPVIVSGTGGAEPDLDIFHSDFKLNQPHVVQFNTKFSVTLHAKSPPYGYCLINGNNVVYNSYDVPIANANAKSRLPIQASWLNVDIQRTEQRDIYVNVKKDCVHLQRMFSK